MLIEWSKYLQKKKLLAPEITGLTHLGSTDRMIGSRNLAHRSSKAANNFMDTSTKLDTTTGRASTWLCWELQAESCVEVTLQLLTNTSLATTRSWSNFALQSSALIGWKPPQLIGSTNQTAGYSLCWGAGSQLGPGQFYFRWIQTRADVCSHGGHPPTQPLSTSHPNQTKTITTHFALCFRYCQKLTPFLFHFFRGITTFLAKLLSFKILYGIPLILLQKGMVF